MDRTEFDVARFDDELGKLDKMFAECGMELGVAAIRQSAEVVPFEKPTPKSFTQEAIDYFSKSIFPSPLRPAS